MYATKVSPETRKTRQRMSQSDEKRYLAVIFNFIESTCEKRTLGYVIREDIVNECRVDGRKLTYEQVQKFVNILVKQKKLVQHKPNADGCHGRPPYHIRPAKLRLVTSGPEEDEYSLEASSRTDKDVNRVLLEMEVKLKMATEYALMMTNTIRELREEVCQLKASLK